jgi:beta-lactamase class A
MKTDVQKIIKGKPGFYSVYYKNLKTGSSFGIAPNQIETGASVNKIPIAASLYYLAGKGKINLDEKVTVSKSEVQDYGTGSIRYQDLPATYSLRDLTRLMLNESDNTAAHVLGVRIGTDVIQNMVDSWGMSQTLMADNKTTAYDESSLMERIYKGQITNSSLTTELLGFMIDTEDEKRLPKLLPAEATLGHKIGDGEGFVHDVGLFKNAKGDVYYLGVMTSDIGDNLEQTNNTIAQISKKIYDEISD